MTETPSMERPAEVVDLRDQPPARPTPTRDVSSVVRLRGERTASPAFSDDGRPLEVTVIAMKTQLRGRIRRTVTTLLEQGAHVRVVALRSDADFAVGLEHPSLEVVLLDPISFYTRFGLLAKRRNERRARRRSHVRDVGSRVVRPVRSARAAVRSSAPARAARAARSQIGAARASAGEARRAVGRIARRFVPSPADDLWPEAAEAAEAAELVDLAVAETTDGPLIRWQRRLLARIERSQHSERVRPLGPLVRRFISFSRRMRRRLYVGRRWILRLRWRARRSLILGRRRLVRARRRTVRFARRSRYRSRRQVRRTRASLRRRSGQRRVKRRQRDQKIRERLRPWHRVSRYLDFWRLSSDLTVESGADAIGSSDLPGLVGAAVAARRLKVPHVHDCHELYLESTSLEPFERRLLAPVERRYMGRATEIVVVNESIRAEYERRYGVVGTVVRNCAELPETLAGHDLRTLAGLPADTDVVLYQGGFSVGRGLDVLVDAVPGFPERSALVMLGFGRLLEELEERVDELGIGDRVRFVDAVPPEELLGTTATATVGVVPYQPVSMNNRLALPNKVFEYTSVGLPVVVADVPELRRIAEAGCGQTYDPFDADDLGRAVREILDPDVLPRVQAQAAEWGAENSWETERNILIGTWERALATRTRRGRR